MSFVELDITSNFTFLTGGSHPEEYAGHVKNRRGICHFNTNLVLRLKTRKGV